MSDSEEMVNNEEIVNKWIIVWCDGDKSYSLIKETEAVFDGETLRKGDGVKFFYNRTQYVGVVREIGGK